MPKFIKKNNNSGFSFIPVIILIVSIGLVGFFTLNYFKNSEDVLQVSTNTVESTITIFPDEVYFLFRSSNPKLLEDQKKRILSAGLTLETYCDEPSCETRKEVVFVSKINDGLDKNNKMVSIQFGTKSLISTSEKFFRMKSLQVNDLISEVRVVKLEGSEKDNWKIQGKVGISKNLNKLTIEDFNPTPAVDPTSINFRFSGEGDILYSFLRNLKSNGVNVRECESSGSNCKQIRRSVDSLNYSKKISPVFGGNGSFSVQVSKNTKLVSLIVGDQSSKNITWRYRNKLYWNLTSDGLTLQNTRVDNVVPTINISLANIGSGGLKFTFVLGGSGDLFNSLLTSLKGGINYTTKTSSRVMTASTSCSVSKCEFVVPADANSIYLRNSLQVNILSVPTGWKLLSEGKTGINR